MPDASRSLLGCLCGGAVYAPFCFKRVCSVVRERDPQGGKEKYEVKLIPAEKSCFNFTSTIAPSMMTAISFPAQCVQNPRSIESPAASSTAATR